MPPRSSQTSKSRTNTLKVPSASSSTGMIQRKLKPLTTFSKPPVFDITGSIAGLSQGDERLKPKGVKGKEKAGDSLPEAHDDRLWVDIYEPTTEAQLAVHKKKVEDVRRWFLEAFDGGPSGKLKKYRRILALTGPAGTAKTTTVRVLARELNFEILEWKNTIGERFSRDVDLGAPNDDSAMDYEDLFQKFQAFLTRASTCQSIFSADPCTSYTTQSSQNPPRSSQSQSGHQFAATNSTLPHCRKQIILLEDLPNILHSKTQDAFHSVLQALLDSPNPSVAPIVIIVSDSGLRGEAAEEKVAQGGGWGKDAVDIRTVLSAALLGSPYVTQIGFNPIAPTLLRRALLSLFASRSSSNPTAFSPSKDFLDVIVESANGDIRSAVMALQFACIVNVPVDRKGRPKNPVSTGKSGAKAVLEAITRREQSLALFHLMGKVLYNKRKGDPPNQSATAKDILREKELDGRLKDSPRLPIFLQAHERKASRVDVETLYADSPIDSSLFSLYVHQNYTQFCDDMEHCEGVSEWLSWIDSSGGESWYQANPHRFHMLTLGTLHSLPSPVERRSQKFFKPEFFDMLHREKDGWDGIGDVRRWLVDEFAVGSGKEKSHWGGVSGWRAGGWSRTEVAVELGGVLKARDAVGIRPVAPASHKMFSRLMFTQSGGAGGMRPLDETDAADLLDETDEDERMPSHGRGKHETDGGWLENDDIEEF